MSIIKYNNNAYEGGEYYLARLQDETTKTFSVLLNLLSSYWKSTSDGPNYTRSLKAISIALSQIRLSLNDILDDTRWNSTRGEFIDQVVKSMVMPGTAVNLESSDVEFRSFLANLVALYFKGSIPETIKGGVELITKSPVVVKEAYKEARLPGSGYDISDEFSFDIEVTLSSPSAMNTALNDRNIRILLQIIRPAHTIYRLKNVLRDEYLGNIIPPGGTKYPNSNKVLDSAPENAVLDERYEDFRKFSLGVSNVDLFGAKKPLLVTGEAHTFP